MKRMLILLTLLAMAAPSVSNAWSPNFYRATEAEMRSVTCQNGGFSNLGFQVIRYRDGSEFQTIEKPVQPDMGPDRGYVEHIRVQAGTELAEMFQVRSTVTHLHEGPSSEVAGPSVWPSAAGTITSTGSRMDRSYGDWYVQAR